MLAVSVTLLHGTVRATSADDLSLTGHDDPGDWPPSPARLVAALIAGDGTRDRCQVTTGSELALFEANPAPHIFASPRSEVLESPQLDRFVVSDVISGGAVQEYPARSAKAIRPGTRLCPRDPRVSYVWPDMTADGPHLEALSDRAARVGYLGCADSPVRISVSEAFDPISAPATVWLPDSAGDCDIPVPFQGFVEVLDRIFDEWSSGKPTRRSQFRAERMRYRSPDGRNIAAVDVAWPTVLWLRLDHALPGRTALRVTETLKSAVIDRYQRDVATSPGELPAILHGHGFDGETGYQLAQWLALPEAGHPHARGRIHGAAIMLPKGTDPLVVAGFKHALWRLRHLVIPGREPVGVSLHAGERSPWATNPKRWCGPSSRWVSVLPVVHERRLKHGPELEDIAQWCMHAGLPAPIGYRLSRVPMLPGAIDLSPPEVFRDRADSHRPYSHLELDFATKVTGPIVLGRARQFGMGLMAPVDD